MEEAEATRRETLVKCITPEQAQSKSNLAREGRWWRGWRF